MQFDLVKMIARAWRGRYDATEEEIEAAARAGFTAQPVESKAIDLSPVQELNIVDHHFALSAKGDDHYRRRADPAEMAKAEAAYREMVRIAPQVAKAMLREPWCRTLPRHHGYDRLRVLLTKRGDIAEALALCHAAQAQGWGNDWDTPIARLTAKLDR